MRDWNVIATASKDTWKQARHFLSRFGKVGSSKFHNVMLLRVEDIDIFLSSLTESVGDKGAGAEGVSHLFPARATFTFLSREEFEAKARAAVLPLAPRLAGRAFHIRMHRRGFKGRISSQEEERALDVLLLEALAAAGTPARITFDDPDAVIDVETVGNRAGLSLWTRDEIKHYPFIKVD